MSDQLDDMIRDAEQLATLLRDARRDRSNGLDVLYTDCIEKAIQASIVLSDELAEFGREL